MNGNCMVYRSKNGKELKPWVFVWSESIEQYVHITSRATRYEIVMDGSAIKPVWIGRVSDTGYLFTAEAAIGATAIQFPDGGRWTFPERKPGAE